MEATLEPSVPSIRNKLALIEAIELFSLFSLGFALWCLAVNTALKQGETILGQIDLLIFLQAAGLGSWVIYNAYIRIARAGGRTLDVIIWVLASLLTGTYTFWAWTILDVNRFIMSKLFYRGEAPVEYAWSWRSKQIRKLWEQANKASN
jgi:hypothetical protein